MNPRLFWGMDAVRRVWIWRCMPMARVQPCPPEGKGVDLPYGALWATLPWPQDGSFDKTALEQRYFKSSQMSGVMPSGRLSAETPETLTYFWPIRADEEAAWRKKSLDAWKDEAIALWPETEALIPHFDSHENFTIARYRHHTSRHPVEGAGLVRTGYAWHAPSPQLGQGANMALLDASALAQAIRTQPNLSDALAEYLRVRGMHVRLYQGMTWLFTPVYQGDSAVLPLLRDWLAAPVSKIWLARL